jgi:chromosome segregation ATPase
LNTELNQLRNSIIDLTSKRSKLQTDKNLVELSLSENLLVREEELEKHVSVIEFGGEGVDLDQTRTDLTDTESNLTTTTTSSNRVTTKIAEVTTEMEKLKNRIDELQEV